MRDHHRPVVLSLILSVLSIGTSVESHAQCEDGWLPGSGVLGVQGIIDDSIVFDDGRGPALYFTVANEAVVGDQIIGPVIRWDGDMYDQVGTGLTGRVGAMVEFNGGLICGGDDFRIDGVDAGHAVRWNGADWESLDNDDALPSEVNALAVFDGVMYAGIYGPSASTPRLHRWNGSTWEPVPGSPTRTVHTLTVFQSELIVSCRPSTFGEGKSQFTARCARWDGENWHPISGSPNDNWNDALVVGVDLIVTGYFTEIDDLPFSYVARWDGETWSALNDGLPDIGTSLAEFNGDIYVGQYRNVGSPTHSLLRWNGTEWSSVEEPNHQLYDDVHTLRTFEGQLYAGGRLYLLLIEGKNARIYSRGLAAWNGDAWANVIEPQERRLTDGRVVFDLEQVKGAWYAAGEFFTLEGSDARNIARLDGSMWQPLGSGTNGVVWEIIEYQGDLIACGEFTEAGGQPANHMARWDGQSWHPLGEGLNGNAYALTIHEGDLIVAGGFTTAGGEPAKWVARWNGSTWHSMGANLSSDDSDNGPYELFVYNGTLLCGGYYTLPSNLVYWTGDSWQPFAGGVAYAAVTALHEFNGDLIIGGWFDEVGPNAVPARHLARYDGFNWHAMGAGVDHFVWSFGEFQGDLLIGGVFQEENDTPGMNFIARWDGDSLAAMDGGMSSAVHAIEVIDEQLVVGGFFLIAGDEVSNLLARWGMMCEGTLAPLTDLQIVLGQQLGGDIDSLREDDDDVLTLRSTDGFSAVEPNITRFRVGAMNEVENATGINLAITARINHPTGVAKVRLKNWMTNQYTIVAEYTLTNVESTESIVEIDATDFIRASDDRLEVDHQIVVAAVFSALGFDALIERVGVETF